ncbi:MAG: UDP-N-acetylglucosamine 2-epimerase (non-hydrolyzing) [Candidatus Riflebacteria bacterium]|nr:UDP-N-acetylglucosamine 2-epimerase (non-hydrolyzing) [Candidatus Riflebacteria bacterium]
MLFKFLFIMGTRPEIIKMAPVIIQARKEGNIKAEILHTGQHRTLAEEMFKHFELTPDYDLAVMQENQSLFELTARITNGIGEVLEKNSDYDMIFVQGDTTSAFLGALCGFYKKIPVAHIEAGLRTQDKYSPFPEEINRRLVTPIASLHFAPTKRAAEMLLAEGIEEKYIKITGNTVIDALLQSVEKDYELLPGVERILEMPGRLILVTTHRRENFGDPHRQIFQALLDISKKYEDVKILLPLHLNPNVRNEAKLILDDKPRILLTEPLSYRNFITAMKYSTIIMSDSGGVQEEAPSLHKPVLVLRDSTERPEGVETGALKIVGTCRKTIVEETSRLLDDVKAYERMAEAPNPYGDGKSSQRIVEEACKYLRGLN